MKLEILRKEVQPLIVELKKGIDINEFSTGMIEFLISDLSDLTYIR